MRLVSAIVAPLCALVAAGCGVHMPAPVVEAVDPDRGWNGEDTVVTIHGRGFYPQVEFDASRRGGADLDRSFQAWLEGPDGGDGRYNLSGTSARDYATLRAIVEDGLPAGLYDLVVVGPTGRSGRLPAAFTVSDTRADRLRVDAPSVTWQVNQFAQIDVFLIDPMGERVFADVPVEVRVAGEGSEPLSVTFGSGGLEDQVVGETGDRVSGRLGSDGFARILLSTPDPGTVTVTATSLSPASRLDSGSLKLLFEPGDELSLDIRLPLLPTPFEVEAGEVFEVELELHDQYGNPVPNTLATVALRNACNTWLDLLQVRGVTRVPVQIRTATGAGCPLDAIVTDEASGVDGSSEPFLVRPGPPSRFTVEVGPNPVVAGHQLLSRITPVDAYGNPAAWAGTLELQDSVGGLGPASCGTVGAASICAAQPTVSGVGVVLHAADDNGLTGASPPYTVLPAPGVGSVDVQVAGSSWAAGEPHPVDVSARDGFGNVMDPVLLGALALMPTDDAGEAECDFDAFLPSGQARFQCALFQVRSGVTLSATVQGVVGVSSAFDVVNGPLGVVHVSAVAEVEAGTPFSISLVGFDGWGHPYLVQPDPVVDLVEPGGSLLPASVTLRPDGTVTLPVTITAAGTTRVQVVQDGRLLGESAPIEVLPGATDTLQVTVGAPWAWVGEPLAVRVETVDIYGNRTPHSGPATIRSRRTATPPLAVQIVDGLADASFTFTGTALHDVVEAEAPQGWIHSSPTMHAVRECATGGPTAALHFGGAPDAVACYDPVAGQAVVAGSFTGSASGGSPITSHVLARSDGSKATASLPTVLLALPDVGVHPLDGLVVQVDHCADEVPAVAFVGLDDGHPVGPVTLAFADPAVDAQSGSTTVEVLGATDCAGDPAGGLLKVRTTLGALLGPTPTGSGLSLPLDGHGDGVFVLDAATAATAGTATVHAWVDSGAAIGLGSTQIVQDHLRPLVLEQVPAGRVLEPVDEIRLIFSEPLLPNSVVPTNFTLTGPAPAGALSVSLENRDTEVVLRVDPPIDGALGTWTVAASDLRDLAGNRMDGAFIGARSAWFGFLGDVSPGPSSVTCAVVGPTGGVFRPDGDDGLGAEADHVEVLAGSTVRWAWWVLTVTSQSTGMRRLRDHVAVSAIDEILIWDGRDQDGRVVDNGTYDLTVEVLDTFGNRSPPCTVQATVDNRLGSLP